MPGNVMLTLPFVTCSGLTEVLKAPRWTISKDCLAPKARDVGLLIALLAVKRESS